MINIIPLLGPFLSYSLLRKALEPKNLDKYLKGVAGRITAIRVDARLPAQKIKETVEAETYTLNAEFWAKYPDLCVGQWQFFPVTCSFLRVDGLKDWALRKEELRMVLRGPDGQFYSIE